MIDISICISTIAASISAAAACYSIYLTSKISQKNFEFSKENKVEDRYFDYVVLFALEKATLAKNNIEPILEQLIKSKAKKTMRSKNDEIQGFFYLYRNEVSLRLRVFDFTEDSFWEKIETEMTTYLNEIALSGTEKNLKTMKEKIADYFDCSIIDIKKKKFS